jgi:hypothetical protein
MVIALHGEQQNGARTASAVRNNSAQRLTAGYEGLESSLGDPCHFALWRQETLEETPVSPPGDSNHAYSAGVDCSHYDLRIEAALQLVGESEPHAPDRFERGFLSLSLGESNDLRPPAHSLQQATQVILHHRQSTGLEPVGQQQAHGGTGLRVKHQHAGLHTLYPTLLLVPSAFEPAIHSDDLGYREALRLEYTLGPRPFLSGVELGDPHSNCAVGPPQPF